MEIASISTALYPLTALACPVVMGAMMWMMRGGKPKRDESRRTVDPSARPDSIELLREQHRRLGEQIEGLEQQRRSQPGSADEVGEAQRGGGGDDPVGVARGR